MARTSEAAKKQHILDTFNTNAEHRTEYLQRNRYYYDELERFYTFNIPNGASVLEIGCGIGQLLAALQPSRGVGIDISHKMIEQARNKYPDMEFIVADAESFEINEQFDYIVISDLIGNLLDVQAFFTRLQKVCLPHTRIIINYYNFLWEPLLKLGEKAKWKMPEPYQNWLPLPDLRNFLFLSDFEVIKEGYKLLFPKNIPVVSWIVNRLFANIPLLKKLCLVETVIARPASTPAHPPANPKGYSCSVIVPCRNERGNIEGAVTRTPALGIFTELIFVDGNSTDGTPDKIQEMIEKYPDKKISLIHQGTGVGKGDAVRKGFAAATGDVLMILDADLTVPPEDLPKFMQAIISGKGEYINGTRLVYPMEEGAMRTLNLLGNKFFSVMFSWLLGQRYRDTLCGTKVLFKHDYERLAAGRSFFGDFDPFGDFDLIFGAAKLNLKTVEIPISYKERTYGTTNISRFKHGWLLLKMCVVAFFKLKLQG